MVFSDALVFSEKILPLQGGSRYTDCIARCVMKKLIIMLAALTLAGCSGKNEFVRVADFESAQIRVYYPQFSRLDLSCGTMPEQTDESVIFCCEAAFTEALLDTFCHTNIDGNHVSDGVWYRGADCVETADHVGNTGGFVWYPAAGHERGKWEFFADTLSAEQALLEAARSGGMGFRQEAIIHRSAYVPNVRTTNPRFNRVELFRVLALFDGQLCIIDNTCPMLFSDFLDRLLCLGVQEALYLDMGAGWNHSWYRLPDGSTCEIHPRAAKSRYCTNWLTFYR